MNIDQLKKITNAFVEELEKSNIGEKTSLSYLVHTLPDTPIVENGQTFQALVIGGSICKKAIILKENNELIIKNYEEKNQPIFDSAERFLTFVENELDPTVSVLALNFAYPLSPVLRKSVLDGILLAGSKEHTFAGLIGKTVGEEIERHVKEKMNREIAVSSANDTICLLLSGLTKYPADSLACGIVGTGLNFAFFQDTTHPVNLESANFDKFEQSLEGKEIDESSQSPGKAVFEKETAGAYLYKHFNLKIQKLKSNTTPLSSTYEVKKLALDPIKQYSDIAKDLVEYSAALVACQVAGITQFKKKDLTFIMDGSFFWEKDIYKGWVEKYTKELVPDYTVSFAKIEDTTVLGAGKLVA